MKRLFFGFIIAILCASCENKISVTINNVTVERQSGDQMLATSTPRFSWNYESEAQDVRQTSYRIIVASSEENAKNGIGDLWNSGVTNSAQMLYIPYEGKVLKSRDKAFWKVITTLKYGKNGKTISAESDVKSFEISLLKSDDWQAKWIGHDFEDDVLVGKTRLAARYLRKDFTLNGDIKKARLYISGLGQYSAFINNTEIAPDELLKPALSDYRKRVYFNAYDVTEMLKDGTNAIDVILAGGRYSAMRVNAEHPQWDGMDNNLHFGTPRLIAQLEVTYQNGNKQVIISDESWKINNRGAIRSANEFDGETYDENYDNSDWLQAELVAEPGGMLTPQPNPNIMVQEVIKPKAIFKRGDKWLLDMGQNMVGLLDIHAENLQNGDTITMSFAETLNSDSSLFIANLRSAEATDRYIVSNSGQGTKTIDWHPMFVYHGFRYVEISGLRSEPSIEDFQGLVFYDKMLVTGSFETSNEIINAVYHNAFWGIRSNYRSMPTDCPQRDERMGWTGDRTTGNYGESYVFDNHQLYSKWLTDAEDCQLENGCVPDVWPPYWRNYDDNMTWPGVFITAADMIYTRFGDKKPIEKHYDAMKLWLSYMKNKYMVDGIMTKDRYGDWCMPPESLEMIHSRDANRITRAPVISTPYYCFLCGKMADFAEILGITKDIDYFKNEIAASTKAYNEKFFNSKAYRYANNTVTANILPLAFGMVPEDYEERVFESIIDRTEDECEGHVSTGVVGIQQLMRTLTEHGRGDLALRIASNDTYPSWGYMYRNGATTIWELWNGNTADPSMNSGNHVMLLGDLLIWEYEYLGGIRAMEPGYSKIQLKPHPIEGLDYVDCSYNSVSGNIESRWTRHGKRFEWDITIPANTSAEVWLPTSEGYTKTTFGSGRYHLKSKIQ